jgi:hypothetical protein
MAGLNTAERTTSSVSIQQQYHPLSGEQSGDKKNILCTKKSDDNLRMCGG